MFTFILVVLGCILITHQMLGAISDVVDNNIYSCVGRVEDSRDIAKRFAAKLKPLDINNTNSCYAYT